MAQQLIRSLSEAERYVVLEHVIEYVSDIRTLVSFSLVSQRARSAIYRSNGLRRLTYESGDWRLNGVFIRAENREEKLKDGLRWIWTVGKRLKRVCLIQNYCQSSCFCYSVIPLLNNLATTEKRRIETIEIHSVSCEMASVLVRENCNTLRRLCVELSDQHSDASRCSDDDTHCSFSEPSESQSFWSVVRQCKRLESLDLDFSEDPNFPVELIYVLRHNPLKYLGLSLSNFFGSQSERLQKLIEVLSVENLRENLESLEFDYLISMLYLCPLVKELSSSHSPVVFVNVTVLTFDLLAVCCQSDHPMNWLSFWTVFPSVKKIEHRFLNHPLFYRDLSQRLSNFCKTYLEVCANRACDIKFEEVVAYYDHGENDEELMSAVAMDATLPEDQDWCVSRGVHIETETSDDKVARRVTLRKDTSTLVFDFKFLDA